MTARNILSPRYSTPDSLSIPTLPSLDGCDCVDASMPAIDVVERLVDAENGVLAVVEQGELAGYIDARSLLEGLAEMFSTTTDSSTITARCNICDYAASAVARAVEDVDASLISLLTHRLDNDTIELTLQIDRCSPQSAARSLERYGFDVTAVNSMQNCQMSVAAERLAELAMYMNV